MKANKIFAAFAMAALALVGCNNTTNPDDPNNGNTNGDVTVSLEQSNVTVKVGETVQLTATVNPATAALTWTSTDDAIATVSQAGVVTGVAKGNAIITVTAEGAAKAATCIVSVTEGDDDPGQGDVPALKGSKIWPIIMDGTTSDKNISKIGYDFRPDDTNKFLYIWDGTYSGGATSGLNFYQTGNDYTSLVVGGAGWAGAGFCMTIPEGGSDNPELFAAMEELLNAVLANPEEYFLHLAIKSTDNYSHCFYFFGEEGTKFGLGKTAVYDAPAATLKDFTRDGSWYEFDIPMANYASVLENSTAAKTYKGQNIFVCLTEGVAGAILNLDAVYFYKK